MNRYIYLHPNRFEYPDLHRIQDHDDDVRMLHSPPSGLAMRSKRDLESPTFEDRDQKEIRTEELDREENDKTRVIVLKKVEEENEESRKTDEKSLQGKEEPTEKEDGDSKDDKEEDKNAETFVAVIAQSILSVPTKRMTLSSIYSYIANHYPHFDKEKGPGWRNSVRHNLSSNDCFVKASRAENGKGHYWMIHPKDLPEFSKGNFRRRRKPRRPKCSHSLMFRDGPLYYHSYGLSYSPYSYPSLRTSQDLADLAYGSTSERALNQNYRSRIGLLSSYVDSDSTNRYAGLSLHPYSSCPGIRGYTAESSLLRSPTGNLSNFSSSFHPVNHYPCGCHRCQSSTKEGHFLCS